MKKCHEIKALGKEITRCKGHKTPVKDYPEPLKIKDMDELIDCFEDRVCRWILKPARVLLKQNTPCGEKDPDVDFAVLAILNAVPEMLAQFQGCEEDYKDNKKHLKKYLYEQGLQYIFPKLKNNKYKKRIMKRLYGSLRNAISHMGLTSPPILLERKTKDPITLCCGRANKLVVIINVPKWYKQTKKRIKNYICELRDPDPSKDDLRRKFRERMERSN